MQGLTPIEGTPLSAQKSHSHAHPHRDPSGGGSQVNRRAHPSRWCQSNVKWKLSTGLGAEMDLAQADPKQRVFLDFRHGSGATMEVLHGDLSARSAKYQYARQTGRKPGTIA